MTPVTDAPAPAAAVPSCGRCQAPVDPARTVLYWTDGGQPYLVCVACETAARRLSRSR